MSTSVLNHYTNDQLQALKRLYDLAREHLGTSGGNTAAKLLLGIYNGRRFPFDLTDLRLFDMGNLEAAMTLIQMDAVRTYTEVHEILYCLLGCEYSVGAEFEHWAYDLRLRGRVKKESLPKLNRGVA